MGKVPCTLNRQNTTHAHVKVIYCSVEECASSVCRGLALVYAARVPQAEVKDCLKRFAGVLGKSRGAAPHHVCILSGDCVSQHRAAQRKPSLNRGLSSVRCISLTSATSACSQQPRFERSRMLTGGRTGGSGDTHSLIPLCPCLGVRHSATR